MSTLMFPETLLLFVLNDTNSTKTAKMNENRTKSFLLFIIIVLNLLIVKIIKSYIHRTENNVFKKNISMKAFIFKISAITGVLMLFTIMFIASSCNKDQTCHGTVTVVDTVGSPVASAKVKLSAPSVGGDVVYDGTTDGSGKVSFDVKLPAIFDVYATKATFPGLAGVGVLRLDEPGTDAEVKVIIQ